MKFGIGETMVSGVIFSIVFIGGLGFSIYRGRHPSVQMPGATTSQSITQVQTVAKAPPCLTGVVPATATDTTQNPPEKRPWWGARSITCPSSMRMVYPSEREVRHGYNVDVMPPSYDNDGSMNWRYQHITCVPDGLSGELRRKYAKC